MTLKKEINKTLGKATTVTASKYKWIDLMRRILLMTVSSNLSDIQYRFLTKKLHTFCVNILARTDRLRYRAAALLKKIFSNEKIT